jgi:hypothetical protein
MPLAPQLMAMKKGELDQMVSRENVNKMLSAGFKPISYRLRTDSRAKQGNGIRRDPSRLWKEEVYYVVRLNWAEPSQLRVQT